MVTHNWRLDLLRRYTIILPRPRSIPHIADPQNLFLYPVSLKSCSAGRSPYQLYLPRLPCGMRSLFLWGETRKMFHWGAISCLPIIVTLLERSAPRVYPVESNSPFKPAATCASRCSIMPNPDLPERSYSTGVQRSSSPSRPHTTVFLIFANFT